MTNFSKKEALLLMVKGMAMGAANVIPGVSGGTIALITGIFERLIEALKSFDRQAIKLLMGWRIKDLATHIDLFFLLSLFSGIFVAIISFAHLFKYLFAHYPILIWSFFFGLVLSSIWFVALSITRWRLGTVVCLMAGTAMAASITLMTPASANDSFLYLMVCGVVAVCSMILPGLSGSFVLILMGNYQLVMIDAVNQLKMGILIPVALGAAIGLPLFSTFLSWLLKRYRNETIALLVGFIAGSLGILWPWKTTIEQSFGGKMKTVGYAWHLPQVDSSLFLALFFAILGIMAIVITEYLAKKSVKQSSTK